MFCSLSVMEHTEVPFSKSNLNPSGLFQQKQKNTGSAIVSRPTTDHFVMGPIEMKKFNPKLRVIE